MNDNALENAKDMSILRMPTECFDFMKRNPQLTEVVGQAVLELAASKRHIEDIQNMLRESQDLRKLTENGTQEETEYFIQSAIQSSNLGIISFNDLPPGVAQEVKNQLGNEVFVTTIGKNDEE